MMETVEAAKSVVTGYSPKNRALQSLRKLIEQGGLREGDRLPAESKLAAQFSVSRMTLRAALNVLEREGLVRREPNIGCVRARSSPVQMPLMARTLVMLTDHQPAVDGKVFNGSSAAIVSGVMDRVSLQAMNFLRINPGENNEQWLADLITARPAGVILSCWDRSINWQLNVLGQLAAAEIPVVSWGDSPLLAGFDCVGSDHTNGSARLIQLLAKHGKRRIARIWTCSPQASWIQAHDRGYDQAVSALGLESVPAVYAEGLTLREPISEASFRVRVRQFAGYLAEHLHSEQPIDAIMVGTDCETVVALAACRLYGRLNIAVAGYDNYWQTIPERQWEPAMPFATVEKNNHRIGEEMVELLMQRIAGVLQPNPQQRLIDQEIVEISSNCLV